MDHKVRCTAITRAGKPCKAWAITGNNPPLCSAHAGRNASAGAPPGNHNARKHGYYSHRFTTQELADLVPHAQPQLAFAPFFAALPLVLIPLLIGC